MASWADVAVYNDMIDDLTKFCTDVKNGCGIIATAVRTCLDNMEQDKASLNASKQVNESVKLYLSAVEKAEKLKTDLTEERDAIIEYLRTLEESD